MNKKSPSKGILTSSSFGTGSVTRGMMRERAVGLAAGNGHPAQDVSKADWEQAKRELKNETAPDPKEVVLEAAPESERWDPVPGSAGHQAPESPPEDEDEEGRGESANLVDQGVDEAERDQMLQAAVEANKTNQREP